jgi:hypothetical protein
VELTLEAWSHAIFGDTDTIELDHMDLVDGFPVARRCEWTCARYFYEGVEKYSASKASCCDQMDMRLTYTNSSVSPEEFTCSFCCSQSRVSETAESESVKPSSTRNSDFAPESASTSDESDAQTVS